MSAADDPLMVFSAYAGCDPRTRDGLRDRELRTRSTRFALVILLALAITGTASGCAANVAVSAKPADFSTPQATLETFFESAQQLDYRTAYSCYYQRYRDVVSEQDFIARRSKAGVLRAYRLDSVSVTATSAVAIVTLTYAPAQIAGAQPRTVQTREDLVKEAGSWKVKVW